MTRVIFMCGPSGSGKTTYARALEASGMVRLSFDAHLWERGIRSGDVPDDVREEVRGLLRAHLLQLVAERRDVVLDFSFWSRAMRAEWRDLLASTGVVPETIYLATDRESVLDRIRERSGGHADDFPVDPETAASYVDRFEVPTPEEGPLTIVIDGEEFAVRRRRPGIYDYDWIATGTAVTASSRRRTTARPSRGARNMSTPSGTSSSRSTPRPASWRTTTELDQSSTRPSRRYSEA